MQQSESIKNLTSALIRAQKEMKPVKRHQENPYFRSKYADLPTVWDACKGALLSNGLTVTQLTNPSESGVVIVTQLMHDSGEWLRGELKMTPVKNDPQGIGSCITYARRYALAAIVGLTPEDDDDGNTASGRFPAVAQKAGFNPTSSKAETIPSPEKLASSIEEASDYRKLKNQQMAKINKLVESLKLKKEQAEQIVGSGISTKQSLDTLKDMYLKLSSFQERFTKNQLTTNEKNIIKRA